MKDNAIIIDDGDRIPVNPEPGDPIWVVGMDDFDIEADEGFSLDGIYVDAHTSGQVSIEVAAIVPEEQEETAVTVEEMDFGGMEMGFVYVGSALPELEVTWSTDAWFHSDGWFHSEAW